MSVWNMIALRNVIGSSIQSVYPRMSGEKDKTPQIFNNAFQPEDNSHNERIAILWSRLGPCRGRSWTTNHFVPLLKQQSTGVIMSSTNIPQHRNSTPKSGSTKPRLSNITEFMSPPTHIPPQRKITPASKLPTVTVIQTDTTAPNHDMRRLSTITMMGQMGDQVKITEIPNFLLPEANEHNDIDVDECISTATANVDMDIEADDNKLTELPVTPNADISMYSDEDGSFTETTSVSHYADATKTASHVSPTANVSMNIAVDESAVEESESSYDDINTTQLHVASTAKPLSHGRWHSADKIFQLIVEAKEVVENVPPGDKSNSYLLVNN